VPVLAAGVERLRKNDQLIESALAEKEEIVAEILQLSVGDYQTPTQVR
jgi:hypothetical protein